MADTMRSLEQDPIMHDYWAGVARGLRRAHFGDHFGTAEEHAAWLALGGDPDPSRAARGHGYRDGLAGCPAAVEVQDLTAGPESR